MYMYLLITYTVFYNVLVIPCYCIIKNIYPQLLVSLGWDGDCRGQCQGTAPVSPAQPEVSEGTSLNTQVWQCYVNSIAMT